MSAAVCGSALALCLTPPAALAQNKKKKDPEWTYLFDGTGTGSLRGYKKDAFPDKSWKLEDGALHALPNVERVDLITKEKYDNFELRFEWKIAPAGNSGVMYRVSEEFEEPWHTGPEYQVLDDKEHVEGKIPDKSAGSLYAILPPGAKTLVPVGKFNKSRIVVKGTKVEHWLEKAKILEYDLASTQVKDLIAKSKFADKPRFAKEKSGHIVFQHHGQEVWFRDIKIKKLSAE